MNGRKNRWIQSEKERLRVCCLKNILLRIVSPSINQNNKHNFIFLISRISLSCVWGQGQEGGERKTDKSKAKKPNQNINFLKSKAYWISSEVVTFKNCQNQGRGHCQAMHIPHNATSISLFIYSMLLFWKFQTILKHQGCQLLSKSTTLFTNLNKTI